MPQYRCAIPGVESGGCGVFRAVDAMRDTEQHWYAVVPEELLYTEARAFVTAFDELLSRTFRERLADYLPTRVLPVSTLPLPTDISLLFDSKFANVRELLKPGKRQRDEARGLIRTMLAMEAHIAEEVEVNERDVDRVEKGIRAGKAWDVVFPRLAQITAAFEGEGNAVVVHISKAEGAPVRIIKADDATVTDATAIREVDLQKRYRYSPTELAQHLELRPHQAAALKNHLEIDEDVDALTSLLSAVRSTNDILTTPSSDFEKRKRPQTWRLIPTEPRNPAEAKVDDNRTV